MPLNASNPKTATRMLYSLFGSLLDPVEDTNNIFGSLCLPAGT